MEELKSEKDIVKKANELIIKLLPPHKVKSRECTKEDIPRIIEDVNTMHLLCFSRTDTYHGAFAIAHSQICDDDPLRFFVTADRQIIINPVIIRKTQFQVDSIEGCMSYLHMKPKKIGRSHKCEIEYVTLIPDKFEPSDKFDFSSPQTVNLSGQKSFIYQHEIDHMDGIYVYDEPAVI